MSDDDVVLANQQHAAKVTPAQWAPLSLFACLIAISGLIDAIVIYRVSQAQQRQFRH